jgi:hypothetical protein
MERGILIMINIPKANEIKELTDNANNEKLKRQEQKAKEYLCETVVSEIIIAAEKGSYNVSLKLEYDQDYIASYIKKYLEEMGYEVSINNSRVFYDPICITIYWGGMPF